MTSLTKLHLLQYGTFDGHCLTFGPGLTVVAGPNEAGKSTALHALADLMWGLPRSHPLYDVTPRSTVKLAATDTQGTLVRTSAGLRDDTGRPVTNPWGTDGDDAARRSWLSAWGITHERLREGGHDLCQGRGDLAELVFVARQGHAVRDLLDEIEDNADRLFKDHANNKKVRVRTAWEDYQRRLDALKEVQVRAADVVAAQTRHETATDAARTAADSEALARRAKERLDEHLRCLPLAQRIHQGRNQIRRLRADGPVLEVDDLKTHDDAQAVVREVDDGLASLDAQLARWEQELDELSVDEAVLTDGAVIDDLWARSQARQADHDRAADLRRQNEQHDAEARAVLESLLGQADPRELPALLASVVVPPDLAAQLDQAADTFTPLAAAFEHSEEAVRTAHNELRSLEAAAPVPERAALLPLAGAVDALTAPDSPRSRLLKARSDETDARHRRCQALQDAGAATTDAAPAVPTEAEVDTAIAQLTAAQQTQRQTTEELRRLRALLADARDRLSQTSPAYLIDPAELAQARACRDDAWARIRSAWLGGTVADDPAALSDSYEADVRAGDDLADRLIDQAAAHADLERTRAEHDAAEAAVDQAVASCDAAEEHFAAAERTWTAWWAARGLTAAPDPQRAQAVRQSLARAAVADDEVRAARDQAAALGPELSTWNTKLTGLLAHAGPPPSADANDLAVHDHLLAVARTVLKEADDAREQQEHRRVSERALAQARERHDADEAALTAWRRRWAELLAAAGLGAVLDPQGWATRSELVRDATEAHQAADKARREADAARQAWDEHTDGIRSLGNRHQLSGDVRAVLSGLHERLTGSRANQKIHTERTEAIAKAHRRHLELTQSRDAAQSQLDTLIQRYDLDGDDTLREAAERGRQVSLYLATETDLLGTLASAAPGRDLPALLAELDGRDEASLCVDAETAAAAVERAVTDREDAGKEEALAGAELRKLRNGGDTVTLNALAQEALADVADATEQYVVLHAQRLILRQALQAHAAAHTSPLLDAAGRVLEQLTSGRWVALQAEDDGTGQRHLVVLRGDGAPHTTATLSEGTADQVFLALRLAGIAQLSTERAAAHQNVPPVVLDDVLMAFDDDRARTALRVLADLAAEQGLQIILFTHHDHLARQAQSLGSAGVRIERLPAVSPPAEPLDADAVRAGAAVAASAAAGPLRATPRRGAASASSGSAAPDPAVVRAWAQQVGEPVSDRGRLPADLVRRYEAAHPR